IAPYVSKSINLLLIIKIRSTINKMTMSRYFQRTLLVLLAAGVMAACNKPAASDETAEAVDTTAAPEPKPISDPLITEIYTADPSAHVFEGKLYIYPSHDIEAGVPENDNGDHFDMRDYHILSMEEIGGPVTDHGVALDIKDVPW